MLDRKISHEEWRNLTKRLAWIEHEIRLIKQQEEEMTTQQDDLAQAIKDLGQSLDDGLGAVQSELNTLSNQHNLDLTPQINAIKDLQQKAAGLKALAPQVTTTPVAEPTGTTGGAGGAGGGTAPDPTAGGGTAGTGGTDPAGTGTAGTDPTAGGAGTTGTTGTAGTSESDISVPPHPQEEAESEL